MTDWEEEQVNDADRIDIIRSLEDLYTFSPMINRTRRRDIGEFTTRKPKTLMIQFTPEQQRLHDDLLGVVARYPDVCARAPECQVHDDHDSPPSGELSVWTGAPVAQYSRRQAGTALR